MVLFFNFDEAKAREGIGYAHVRGGRLFLAINVYPQPSGWEQATCALDRAAELGVDALASGTRRLPRGPRHTRIGMFSRTENWISRPVQDLGREDD